MPRTPTSDPKTGPPGADHRRRARLAIAVLVLVITAGAVVFHVRAASPSESSAPVAASGANHGTATAFAYLAGQHSNFCSLARGAVESDPSTMRLQGACCNAMDLGKYQEQVRDLRPFASIPQIPPDPYDIAVPLARALFHDDDVITLSAAQTATYNAAMGMTADKGPCCCHCWRWSMIAGLTKRLISVNQMPAATVARAVDLVNGCGGPLEAPATPTAPA